MSNEISIVTTARNDDYGGNLLNRVSTFLKVLHHLTAKHRSAFELIVVDYNPPIDKPPLRKALAIETSDHLEVRFISVPPEFHDSLDNSSKIPLMEYIAKNIAVRRARADYVLATNPDIVFSDSLVEFLTNAQLDDAKFYRAHRHDISVSGFGDELSPEQILQTARDSVERVLINNDVKYVSYRAWLRRVRHARDGKSLLACPALNGLMKKNAPRNVIHEHAAGDFVLAKREIWERCRGYDETPASSYIDGYLLYVCLCHGYEQAIVSHPIYHISHAFGKGGRPEVDYSTYREDVARMLQTGEPYKINGPDWGYPDIAFEEYVA
jgi:hypothetical protein